MISYLIQRSEIGAGTRGSSLGFDAMCTVAVNAGSDVFLRYPVQELPHRNDALNYPPPHATALRIDEMLEVWRSHADGVRHQLLNDNFPILISGDHGSAGATIAGLKAAAPNKRLGVVWIDAHADLHSPYTTPSGNVHGMPLGACIADDNLEKRRQEPSPRVREAWEEMKNLAGNAPKLLARDVVYIGIRDTEEEEDHLIRKHGMGTVSVEDVAERGPDKIVRETLDHLSDCDMIYVSFDVDCLDPDVVSYGTGVPVPGGLYPEQCERMVGLLMADRRACCFELVEINPLLDNRGNRMAEVAFDILCEAITQIEKRHSLPPEG